MQEITIDLNNDHSVGLGDNLCLLSAMANLPAKVTLEVSNEHNTFDRLQHYARILQIPSYSLTIKEVSHSGRFRNTGWPLKAFTDYYKTQKVNVNGQRISTQIQDKRCIALITASQPDPGGRNEWPWSRNRPPEYWEKMFSWIKSIDYEVITLDVSYFDLEDKIELLTKYCCAMISYEGGMAHLAHMINVPCFIVDWKHPSPSTHLNVFHVDFVHRTNSVYILREDNELFSWDRAKFDTKVRDLYQGKGNNRFVSKEFTFDFVGPNYQNNLRIYNKSGLLCLETQTFLGKDLGHFLHKYYQKI
jgi:hypothetical protein